MLQDLTPGCLGKAKHTLNPRPTPALSIHQLFPARALGLLGGAEQILWLMILEEGTTEPLHMPGQSGVGEGSLLRTENSTCIAFDNLNAMHKGLTLMHLHSPG